MEKKRFRLDLDRGIFSIFSSKQAQVTVFIILGLILLIALVLVIVLKNEIITFKPGDLSSLQKGSVEDYLTACIEQLGEEAVFKIGQQGGYIELPTALAVDPRRSMATSPITKVPIWAYGKSVNVPPLSDIKSRIDDYIKDNLRSCVFRFEPFTQQYSVVEKGPITVNTEIVESQIIFNVNWDLEIRNKAGEMVVETINHVASSQIKLKKVYETAALILEKEMANLKLEDITQDLLALEHSQIPLSGMELSCTQKEWNAQTVEENLRKMLRVNIRELQIKGTSIIEYPEELTYYQNHYLWDMGEGYSQPQVSVSFLYDDYKEYPYYFNVAPRSGDRLKSNQVSGSEVLSFFCMQNWKFVYDITYPVMINVRDETTDYVFKYLVTVHIKHNYPDRGEELPESNPLTLSTTLTYDSKDFCAQSRVPMIIKTYAKIENGYNGVYFREPLEEANVSFSCLHYRCSLGSTEYDFFGKGDVSGVSTSLPYCAGGIVRAEKPGYKDDWQRIVTEPNKEVELNLTPIVNLPLSRIKVVKHEFFSPSQIGPAVPLSQDEYASIMITFDQKDWTVTNQSNVNTNLPINLANTYANMVNSEHTHQSQIVLSPKMDPNLGISTLQLLAQADFSYDLRIDLFSGGEDQSSLTGGYHYNWTVSWEELQSAKELTFHVLTKPNANEQAQLEMMNDLEMNSVYIPTPEIT
ncbi:MAG: hypothetical protein WCV90_05540 [Candidatus Woesearchaeota archaeon]|jgi:hypothetical protein